ncbi:PIG-L family deacetylase [Georgenia sp. TF02-10]|uniref:PIG-L family deacetylase n=1 Tax=Georgenia sp. TF02-10 TaxID=2917725 RepID=UPI001FA7E19C|nr:PIG-L family deacetylase [Georgenia sp. TF02-10]UNX55668.1 PIG-L family deacetylase [Georgenia sp. TF02-10]
MARTPPPDQAPLPTGGLLGVFAHPDDETLGAGGLLAMAARAGVGVAVVTGTRGERGQVIPADLAHLAGNGLALARRRERELAHALHALGVTAHRFLDALPGLTGQRPARFTDSGMVGARMGMAEPAADAGPSALAAVPLDVPARLLAAVVRSSRPQVVITEEPGGGYGHPDHVRIHEITMAAVALAADAPPQPDDAEDPLTGLAPWRVPVVGWLVESEPRYRDALHWLETTVREHPQFGVRGDALATFPADADLPSLVRDPAEVDLTVDVTPALAQIATAMRAHRTQVQSVRVLDLGLAENRGLPACGWFAVSNGLLLPVLDTTSLQLAPGHDRTDELQATREVDGLARDRLGARRGTDRLAAFLGAEVAA